MVGIHPLTLHRQQLYREYFPIWANMGKKKKRIHRDRIFELIEMVTILL
jgi:hypothetical protein